MDWNLTIRNVREKKVDDSISRKAVIEGINYLSAFYRANYKKEPPISAIIDGINNMPVDKTCEGCVPEIIKCKDCKHYVEYHKLCKGMDQYTCHMNPDDFCSHGEKRERSKEHGRHSH